MNNLEVFDALITVIDAAGNTIHGRTVLQKLLYFGTVKGFVKANYRPHYYGPFSAEVAGVIDQATAMHFLDERTDTSTSANHGQNIEWRRYNYSTTSDGKKAMQIIREANHEQVESLRSLVITCKEVANLDVNVLSWAAKVHFILAKRGGPLTMEEIARTAETYNWTLTPDQIKKASLLLQALALVQG